MFFYFFMVSVSMRKSVNSKREIYDLTNRLRCINGAKSSVIRKINYVEETINIIRLLGTSQNSR